MSRSPAIDDEPQALLPIFVYGTLRVGEVNWARLLRGRTVKTTRALLPDHCMWDVGIPYVSDREGSTVVGDLVEVPPEGYRAVLDDLDRLEGYVPGSPDRSHYVRVVRAVDVAADGDRQSVHAWVYQAGPAALGRLASNGEALVASGDWLNTDDGVDAAQ